MHRATLSTIVCLMGSGPLAAQFPELGQTTFPTSAAAEAHAEFIKGVLLLHSFEYERARAAFREAQRLDADFAMAYWGEAMTWNHPVWFLQYRDSAHAALARLALTAEARRAKAPTGREKAYLDAVETLFGEGPKARRDTLYMHAMRGIHERWPDDENAAAFYALAILGTSHGGRHVPTYLRAAEVVEGVFADNPRHPGAAHYLIHSYDDPINAPKGLAAARAYIDIAPDAAHAQHMTTHIFVAMGMWDEVVSQNTIASSQTHWGPGHYTSWLGYGYLQQGRSDAALELLENAREKMNDSRAQRSYLIEMRGDYVVGAEVWDSPALRWRIEIKDLTPSTRAEDAFIQALAAHKRGDDRDMERSLAEVYRQAGSAMRTKGLDSADRLVPQILEAELRGLLALRVTAVGPALHHLWNAAKLEDAMPFEFGPPAVVKPAHELLGEVLLSLARYAEAQREFERALELTPKRALSLRGLIRAAEGAKDTATANAARRTLEQIWHSADPEARTSR